VSSLEGERTEQFTTIVEQLRTQQTTDNQLRNTTNMLANALTNNQTRGGWGETRLEDIVKAAGLIEGVHYEKQFETVNHEDETVRPDMVVKLPESRFVAIDSKVPLINYWRALDEREKGIESSKEVVKQHMKLHIAAVKKHISDLAKKDYWSGLDNSPEFTLMFVPSEPLLAATLDEENLMEFAFQNRVALVSPVSLFSVLKTVAYTWRQNADEQVIHKIIELGTELFKQVRLIGEKYAKLGGHIDAVVDDYNKLLVNLDNRLLEPTRSLNKEAQYRLGIEGIPEQKQVERSRKKPVSPELIEGLENQSEQ
jgi:DNA recombination protein RmuC